MPTLTHITFGFMCKEAKSKNEAKTVSKGHGCNEEAGTHLRRKETKMMKIKCASGNLTGKWAKVVQ